MTTKTISIMEDAYRLLLARKRAEESFSDVIRRELSKKGRISESAGVWSDMTDEQLRRFEDSRRKARSETRKRVTENLK
jgi:predicted CopG family antitoxin